MKDLFWTYASLHIFPPRESREWADLAGAAVCPIIHRRSWSASLFKRWKLFSPPPPKDLLTPHAPPLRACRVSVHGRRRGRGCRVTDDTGAVIPLTSASNLQHEKDTPVTPYPPPTNHLPPPLPPSLRPAPPTFCSAFNSLLFLSFQPKSNSVSGFPKAPRRNSQSNTQKEALFIPLCRSDLRLH